MEKSDIFLGLVSMQKDVICSSLLIIISIYLLYQARFHPLAKYPGPLSAKFSIARATYHVWKGDSHIDIWQLHRKYGPIVRYGPNWVIFNSVEGYKDIYGLNRNTEKHRHFSQFNPRAINLFIMHNKKHHCQRRRYLGQAFSATNIKKFENRLLRHIRKFCHQVCPFNTQGGNTWSSPLKMSDWAAYLIFDTLTDFIFSADYNLLESETDRHIIYHIKEHIIRPAMCTYMPLLAFLKIDKFLFKKATRSTKVFWRWVKSAITARVTRSEELGDLFTRIQQSRSSEVLPSIGIQSEVGMFIVAGLDTTTSALCALLFYLSRNHPAYRRLCLEIRSSFKDEHEIRIGQKLRSCTYLHACIEEALRMSPPVGSPPWREIGIGGEVIAGHAIPQGCSVGTGIYSMHHCDAYFENPHHFIPDRWFSGPGKDADRLCKLAFMPFSTGPRSCIGRSLAYSQLLLTVATMLWKYDFRASSGHDQHMGGGNQASRKEKVGRANPEEFQLVDWVVGIPEGPVLDFRLRDASCIQPTA